MSNAVTCLLGRRPGGQGPSIVMGCSGVSAYVSKRKTAGGWESGAGERPTSVVL